MPEMMDIRCICTGMCFRSQQSMAIGLMGAMRDTVLVPPNARVTVAFDADNPGWWALHCHLAYHQAAGMFATVRYA